MAEWKKWRIEGVRGGATHVSTPDGKIYELRPEESFMLEPDEPKGGVEPAPYVKVNELLRPFAEWAKENPGRLIIETAKQRSDD